MNDRDLISRSALSMWCHETMKAQTTVEGMAYIRDFWNKVLDAPAVDAVAVCRCKDCEYATDEGEFGHFCRQFPYGGMGGLTNDDDFCSYGERKDGADG